MKKDFTILGIESTCDETSAAVLKGGTELLSNVIYSQIDEHKKYHGVVPELASRAHAAKIAAVIESALGQTPIDCVAFASGPGLPSPDVPLLLCGMLGLFFLLCTYSAIGIFMSSLTSYQVVAALATFALLAVLSKMRDVGQDTPWIRDLTWWLSIDGRCETFITLSRSCNRPRGR